MYKEYKEKKDKYQNQSKSFKSLYINMHHMATAAFIFIN